MSLLREYRSALDSWRIWSFLGLNDVRSRYKRTLFGPFWHALTLGIWGVGVGYIYGALFNQDMSFFLPYLTIGFVLWGSITTSLVDAGYAFINSEGYIKQFPRPRQIYVLRFWLANLIMLGMGVLVFLGIAFFFNRPFDAGSLWAIPGLIAFAAVAYAHSSILSHVTVFARDVPHLMSGIVQVLFFVTPIIYTTEMLARRGLQFVYEFNPLWYVLEIVRYPLMHATAPATEIWSFTLLYLLLVATLAVVIENACKKRLIYHL